MGTYGHLTLRTASRRGFWGHTDISLYEQLPGRDFGDIRTSHCTNSFQEGTLGTYGHLTVRTASRRGLWGHRDISLYEWLPGGDIGDIRTSHCTNGFHEGTLGTYGHPTVGTASRGHTGISLYGRLPGQQEGKGCRSARAAGALGRSARAAVALRQQEP